MASKKRARHHRSPAAAGRPLAGSSAAGSAGPNSRSRAPETGRPLLPDSLAARIGLTIVALVAIAIIVLTADAVFGAIAAPPAASPSASPSQQAAISSQSTAPSRASHWTDITSDQLAQMLQNKDFTLINVKTPYIGEIEGTDLWIPYDQLAARASELPADKGARIVVYCRTGTTSAIAAQTLLDLGYTNVWNLEGGMNAWTASGRTLVNKNRG